MSEIQKYDGVAGGLQIRGMEDLSRLSTMLSKSGFFSDARDAAQCGVKVLAGLEMGFGAFAAMTGIHIIKGKPSIGANLMAAAVKRHPNYNYRVLEHSDSVCRIAFYERWDGKLEMAGESSFSIKDAQDAGLLPAKPDSGWAKYPKNMLFARAMSNGVKWYCPDIFDAPVYTPEELGATVDGEGNYIEAAVVPAQPKPVEAAIAPANPGNPFIEQSKAIIAYATENGFTVDDVKSLCRANNLPDTSAGYVDAAQVTTLAALVEELVSASATDEYEGMIDE